MLRCVDLFAGCGGLSLGLENAGFEINAAVDIWPKAVNVYNENFQHPCYEFDLKDEAGGLDIIRKYTPEMIIGGPPCQDFSSAGKRDESLGRADLTYNYANIVCSYKPEWFIMENVERIKSSSILKDIIEQFEGKGYGLTAVILNAAYCGVPQARKRFFLIGELGGHHNSLLKYFEGMLSFSPMTIRDYLGDSLGVQYYYRHPRSYARRGIFSIDEPSPTIRGVNRPIPEGYKKHKGDPCDIELSEVRPLTTIERSYLQTFPKTFILNGSKTDLEQMIGNAVPVKLAEYLGRCILKYLEAKKTNQSNHILSQKFIYPISSLRPKSRGF